MTENIILGPDAQIRFALQRLRIYEGEGEISGANTQIIDGAFLSNDPEAGIVGSYVSSSANLIKLQQRVEGASSSRWQGLHIVMGPMPLSDAAVIGIVARSVAPTSITTRICVRSGRNGKFIDTFFPKTMVSFAAPSTHLDIMEISKTPDLPHQAQWRDLILFFRNGDLDIELLDLRLFVV